MAKSKKKADSFAAGTEAGTQINRLIESMETYTKHRIECWCCMETDTERDITEARFARRLFEKGWRYKSSEKFATIGALCPKCAKKTDAELGEDEDDEDD